MDNNLISLPDTFGNLKVENSRNLFNTLGRYDESNNAYNEAIKIKPDYSKAFSNLLFNFIYKIFLFQLN